MLYIENEYETSIDSNFYQNNESFDNFEKSVNRQITTDYTKQDIEESSDMNKIYQNTTKKIQLTNERIWIIPFLSESSKQRFSTTRPAN